MRRGYDPNDPVVNVMGALFGIGYIWLTIWMMVKSGSVATAMLVALFMSLPVLVAFTIAILNRRS